MIEDVSPLRGWSVSLLAIPETGLESRREASAGELSELARALDVPSCERLAARFAVRAIGGGRFRVEGHVSAALTQRCVITLEPVPATIEEPFDEEFWPAGAIEPEDGEHEHEALTHVEPEPIVDGRIEIGQLVYETIAAALPPYPRKPGVELEWSGEASSGPEPGPTSPFAALAKLKGK